MYHQFNTQQFYVLPTWCVFLSCVDLRTNNDYFPTQHFLTGFCNRYLTSCSPVVTICATSLTFNNATFCPHSVFMCFVWIWEQTATIILHNINWLVCITDIKPITAQWLLYVPPVKHSKILSSTHTVHLCVLCGSESKQRLFPYTALSDWFYNRCLPIYSPVVIICTTSLTPNNSTFFPHSVLMCFVWIWEHTAVISLHSIIWFAFVTDI